MPQSSHKSATMGDVPTNTPATRNDNPILPLSAVLLMPTARMIFWLLHAGQIVVAVSDIGESL